MYRWSRGAELLFKVGIFFFAHKMYTRSLFTLWLKHWWQMDYFDDVFHTFLGRDSVIYLGVNGTVIPFLNYLKLCFEDELSFCGFGTTWGKWLMTKFSFWDGVTKFSLASKHRAPGFLVRHCWCYSCSSAEKMEDCVQPLRVDNNAGLTIIPRVLAI